uniref:Bulb-type lectin domain-containing protein n=1 Tax=Oryza punctata TaxID=4537 RepID=A0A0E0M3V9_ORYPU
MSSSLAILLLLMRLAGAMAASPTSYISRTTEQQVIATVAPAVADADVGQSAQPFLTSPSGSYAAYLRRAVDSSAGGPGADACYVQIQQADGGAGAAGGRSVWESECTLVGGADACDLAFSPVGLELFAGGHSLWDTGIDAEPGTLSLDDGGDMRIVSKDGVTVWQASGEPWTGQQCGAAVPVSPSPMDVLPPPSTTTSAKLLTPPASTLAGAGSSDMSFGDQLAPPDDTSLPASPDQSPVDTMPDQPLLPPPPPPADATPASPDLPLPPPPADMYPVSPDQPLYSSPPPAPTAFVPHTPLPPVDVPPLSPPPASIGGKTPSGAPGDIALPPSPAGGVPHQHDSPHHLPLGSSPPAAAAVPDALAPSGGNGAAGGLPFGQGQQQGAFGQHQLLNGAGEPLEDSSGERSRDANAAVAVTSGLVGLVVALGFGF